jgi:DNA-directed RNA polymerase specialized sigma subunit
MMTFSLTSIAATLASSGPGRRSASEEFEDLWTFGWEGLEKAIEEYGLNG